MPNALWNNSPYAPSVKLPRSSVETQSHKLLLLGEHQRRATVTQQQPNSNNRSSLWSRLGSPCVGDRGEHWRG